tara:strand:- start:556 stop:738 length:183 start_codon:yes stop_codon:yes gene_type:complete
LDRLAQAVTPMHTDVQMITQKNTYEYRRKSLILGAFLEKRVFFRYLRKKQRGRQYLVILL